MKFLNEKGEEMQIVSANDLMRDDCMNQFTHDKTAQRLFKYFTTQASQVYALEILQSKCGQIEAHPEIQASTCVTIQRTAKGFAIVQGSEASTVRCLKTNKALEIVSMRTEFEVERDQKGEYTVCPPKVSICRVRDRIIQFRSEERRAVCH